MALLCLGWSMTACKASDAEVICDKADECNFLFGISRDDCVDIAEDEGTESELQTCADCGKDKSCPSLTDGACAAECSFLTLFF
jgi:hypothetical protein